jgi:HPt (histidine-containing phosphotransfer) domain-containing protein
MANESGETPLFDPVAIERLRAVAGDQGAGFVAEMAQLFLDETTKSLDDLKQDSERGDWKHVTQIAHSLKSSSATLGLMRLSAACKALELDTKGGASSPRTTTLSAAVLKEFEEAKPTLLGLS